MPISTDAARTTPPKADRRNGDEVVLKWRVHGLRDNPRGLILVVGAYIAALILWHFLSGQSFTLCIMLLALTSAVSTYLLPISYGLTTQGAYSNCGFYQMYIAWSDVKRVTFGDDGVHLSPFASPSQLDNYRGVRLAFVRGNRDEVLEGIRKLRGGEVVADGAGEV